MSSKPILLHRLTREEVRELFRRPTLPNDSKIQTELNDLVQADMVLGLAAQDRCETREDLLEFASDAQLLPYVRYFLERRGWYDEDWEDRINDCHHAFQKQLH